MVYSASAIVAADRFHDPYFFLKKQVFWALLGGAGLWLMLRVDYRRLEGLVLPLLIVSAGLLVLVLIPPVGQAINGTRRWIRLGPARERVPDHPVVARLRQRRRAGPGGRRLEAEALLPARVPHRLHLRHHRRGARLRRRSGGRGAIRRARLARAPDRAPRPRAL